MTGVRTGTMRHLANPVDILGELEFVCVSGSEHFISVSVLVLWQVTLCKLLETSLGPFSRLAAS